MSVTYDAPAAGEEVVYQNVAQIIDGITGVSMIAHSLFNDHATNPPLKVKSTSTTDGSPGFIYQNAAGTDSIIMRRHVAVGGVAGYDDVTVPQLVLTNDARMIINPSSSAINRANLFTIGASDSDPKRVAELIYYTNNSLAGATPPPDVASSAIIIDSGSGDAYCRALEIDMLARGSSGFTWPKLGIELSIESNSAGNGSDETVGIAIHNYFDAWFGGSSVAVDTGLLIGRDNAPFTNFIRCMGNDDDANASTVLFNVQRDGTVQTRSIVPLTDSSWQLGTVSLNFNQAWVDTYFSTTGIHASTLHYSLGATNTGILLPASNAIGFMNNSTETIRIESGGLLSWRLASQTPALGGGAAPTLGTIGGSGPTTAAQNKWLKMSDSAGTAIFVPVWV